MGSSEKAVVGALLEEHGRTYATEAGIRLADKPGPLYQVLVLGTLLSARISAEIAIAAARELFAAGLRTPEAMEQADWQARVDALGRGHYRRYDERTATQLGEGACLLRERWAGDLRRLRDEAKGDAKRTHDLLTEFPGIGPVGADIYLREVQAVWPQVAPYFDKRVLEGARRLGLPHSVDALADLAGSGEDLARLAAALVRVSLSKQAAETVKPAAESQNES
ncbi:endonuclease [Sphaerisporangium viridialbum]|uniref:endonuclease n=1 Tax=Sphaerisporangium viridialbum TaxID=46189 RepID=UPI003C787614